MGVGDGVRRTVLAVASVAVLLGLSGCAAESPDPAGGQTLRFELDSTPRPDLRGGENPTNDPAVVNALWDSAQLRKAVPVDAIAEPRGPGGRPAPNTAGQSLLVVEPKAAETPQASGGAAAPTEPLTTGRLFFTVDGVSRTCTASVVSSGTGQVIATAGHCLLSDGVAEPRTRSQNLMFVPSYRNGTGPVGRWFADDVAVAAGWKRDGDWSQDVGFVRLNNQSGGLSVQDLTGGLGAVFGRAGTEPVTVLGYPAAGRYDGQSVQRCAGSAADSPPPDPSDPTALAAPCTMTAGYSGGPWLLAAGAADRVVAVSSHDYGRGVIYGARLGAGALEAFRRMDRA